MINEPTVPPHRTAPHQTALCTCVCVLVVGEAANELLRPVVGDGDRHNCPLCVACSCLLISCRGITHCSQQDDAAEKEESDS